jgi:hypothetical protein
LHLPDGAQLELGRGELMSFDEKIRPFLIKHLNETYNSKITLSKLVTPDGEPIYWRNKSLPVDQPRPATKQNKAKNTSR